MPLYFAYGANMHEAEMALRCPGARVVGRARLARHRFFVMNHGYASVTRDPARDVHGLLWEIGLAHVRTLDAFEELGRGLYTKISQGVILAEGGARRALIYVGASLEPGRPKPGYMERIVEAAEAAGLPAAYRRELSGFLPRGAGQPRVKPATPTQGPVAGVRPRFASPVDPARGGEA
ncbi:MAG: gamma-glutamylcyclotransferase [Rhizobiales bacterium]|nr:gamma-glutamylcyclotransferase [Hyphomicrobiales bacterium]